MKVLIVSCIYAIFFSFITIIETCFIKSHAFNDEVDGNLVQEVNFSQRESLGGMFVTHKKIFACPSIFIPFLLILFLVFSFIASKFASVKKFLLLWGEIFNDSIDFFAANYSEQLTQENKIILTSYWLTNYLTDIYLEV